MPVWVVEKHGEILEQWASLKDVLNGKILMSLSWLDTTKDNSTLESKNPLFLPNRKGIFMNQTTFLLFNVHTLLNKGLVKKYFLVFTRTIIVGD